MSNFFFRYHTHNLAAEASREAQDATQKAQDSATQVEFMKRDIERLLMLNEALWLLLQRAHGYTDEDLRNTVADIDLRDGQLDGRVKTKQVSPCPACHRPVSTRHYTCIYCGQGLRQDPFAR